jgi:hypothetical protein
LSIAEKVKELIEKPSENKKKSTDRKVKKGSKDFKNTPLL